MDQINQLEKEIVDLRKMLQEKEDELLRIKNEWLSVQGTKSVIITPQQRVQLSDKLPKWAIERYSRQILLPDIGVKGQERLCAARVLIVGAGGLGCPAAVYLACAGVGEIGIVDYDSVDVTNIHRQFLHGERDQYRSKVESAAAKLRSLNSTMNVTPYNVHLDSKNALQIASGYDLVLDCTDNVPTRYLLNDTCVLSKLPLISGSALKMEGQLTLYGYRGENIPDSNVDVCGPCYRCVFPSPPPPEAVGSCSANGVAGPVPGVIGSLQALEAIKYIVGQSATQLLVGRMLLFDGDDMTFRTVRLRPRNPQCAVCSDSPTITQLIDYEIFCQAHAKEKPKTDRKTELRKAAQQKRMSGQTYVGYRTTPDGHKKKWTQDVIKSERKLGPPCTSDLCSKSNLKKCYLFDSCKRQQIFKYFWNELDWKAKRSYVRSLIDSVPVKRRRVKHKGEISRKGDSKLYHLFSGEERLPVCRVMFLNTLGLKEAMIRTWLRNTETIRTPKPPIKTLHVDSYIDNLPRTGPRCSLCLSTGVDASYINIDGVKNLFQLYNMYVNEMNRNNNMAASRKTFSKVFNAKKIRIFKPKNQNDVCDLVTEHNSHTGFGLYYDLNNGSREWSEQTVSQN